MRTLSPDWEAMFPPPGNPPPPVPPSSSTGYTGHMSTPLHKIPIYTIFSSSFFFFFFWLHIGRIAPEPFFNQLLLSVNNFISWDIGYSLVLSILCYHLSLSFGLKPYGT